jgi:hypothetical protein
MSTQTGVHSIDALKDFRVALALFAEDSLAALGAVDMELRRTVQWLQHNRRGYWQEQIKRRRERVAAAKAEVFRRTLGKTADYTPPQSEQKEELRKAEASLREAEMRAALVKKWEPALQQAIFEYHGSTRRIKDMASGDVPRALVVLERLIDAVEAYLRVAPPSNVASPSPLESIANAIMDDGARTAPASVVPEPDGNAPATSDADAPATPDAYAPATHDAAIEPPRMPETSGEPDPPA